MDKDVSEASLRKALEDLSAHLRVSLNAILTHAAALREADERNAGRAERSALLDAIQREGRHALDLLAHGTAAEPARPTTENRPKAMTAYSEWLRSRLEQIEAMSRAERTDEVRQLALQLKDSAAAKGYREIAEAGAAVERFSEAGGHGLEAAVEILRRTVNRAIRRITDAA